MKFTENTIVPKIIAMTTELSILDRTIDEVNTLFMLKDELEYVSKLQKMIEKLPKLKYFEEEVASIKECLGGMYDGYESKEDGALYMNFLKRVVLSAKDYVSEMKG